MQFLKTKDHNLPVKLSLQRELESDIQSDHIYSKAADSL